MNPHRVLHVLGTARPEGTATVRIVAALASGLDPRRYSVHAWFLDGAGPLVGKLRAAGVQVRVVNWLHSCRDPLGAWRFWRAFRSERFTILHQHFGAPTVRWLAHLCGARTVLHLHGRANEGPGLDPAWTVTTGADVVIANSRAVASCAIGKSPQVVYPGISVGQKPQNPKAPRSSGARVIGTACRLVPIKGLIYLIRAMAILRVEISNLRLEIAGDGPERMVLENEVQSLGLSGCITFLGWIADLPPVLASWDIFVLPSLQEGFGMAALEAMAAGLPVVASAVGGLAELVEDERTGYSVPRQDAVALAERLRALLLNPGQCRAMGAAGRSRAQEYFPIEKMVAEISNIYNVILGC